MAPLGEHRKQLDNVEASFGVQLHAGPQKHTHTIFKRSKLYKVLVTTSCTMIYQPSKLLNNVIFSPKNATIPNHLSTVFDLLILKPPAQRVWFLSPVEMMGVQPSPQPKISGGQPAVLSVRGRILIARESHDSTAFHISDFLWLFGLLLIKSAVNSDQTGLS